MGGLFGRGGSPHRAERISDFNVTSASYGEVVPEVLGTTRLSGNIIQWEDFTTYEHRTRQRIGFRKKVTSITYTYSVAVALGLCEGPIDGIGKIWIDKEVYDYPSTKVGLTAYVGQIGQKPWPYMVGKHPDRALPYSGLCYMAGVVDLGSSATLPNLNFEVRGKLLETGDGIDVNPADYIVHILKGVGIDETVVDGLENFRSYCNEADILISTPPDSKSEKAQKVISDIADICNCYLFWSNDRLKIVPLADKPIKSWNPNTNIQYDLTSDDFLSGNDGRLIEYKRKTSSESYNTATVEFINRANGYEKEAVTFEVLADVQRNGLKPAPSYSAHYIYTKARATYLAEQLAMKRLYERNQYTFKLDWAFCRLEPGDLVTLTEPSCGLHRQIVVITDIQEAQDGELLVTAIGKPPGIYGATKYDVHENERPYVDYNVPAKPIVNATFIQPPADLTEQGQELWVGVSTPPDWGGCEVWMSDDPSSNYESMGMLNTSARIGRLESDLPSHGTSCVVRMVNGTLKSRTHVEAERGNTACYINGECLSYERVTLNQDGTLTLHGLVRGQFNTPIGNHSVGDTLSRLDEGFMRIPYRKQDIGKRVYAKFTSLNNLGGQEEELDEVKQYEYVIQEYFIPEVSDVRLHNKYRQLGGKAVAYDLVATFTPPNLKTLSTVVAWYREKDVGAWTYGGDGNGQIIISQCEVGKTYEVRLQVKDIHGNYSTGLVKSLLIALKSEIPNAPDGVAIRFSEQAIVTWREVQNADVDFYEVRLLMNPGEDDGLLAKVSSTTATCALQNRRGNVYVYAHNPVKGYSAPSILSYHVPPPPKPTKVHIKSRLGGLAVTFGVLPSNASHANIYVNEEVYQTPANSLFIPLEANVYNVSVSFVDMFGEGERTDVVSVGVKDTVTRDLLDDETVGLDQINSAIDRLDGVLQNTNANVTGIRTNLEQLQGRIQTTVNNSITGLSSKVTQLEQVIDSKVNNATTQFNTRITQLDNAIKSQVIDGEKVMSALTLYKGGARIDGRLLHVTGDALFDENIVTNKMLQANAVTADKISVENLGAISANVGTLRGGEIIGTVIRNENNTFSVDSSGNIRGAKIDADSFRKSGLEITAIKVFTYSVEHEGHVPIPRGFERSECNYIILGIEKWIHINGYSAELRYILNQKTGSFINIYSWTGDAKRNKWNESISTNGQSQGLIAIRDDGLLIALEAIGQSNSRKGVAKVMCIAVKR